MREPELVRLEIDGGEVAVRLAGDPTTPPLLLIHGFPISSESFRNVIGTETQRALVLDYRSHVARFREIADYLDRWQPPALMLWGRHDIFFDLDETLSWMKALPRMEATVLDGPHFLLETHPAACAALIAFPRSIGKTSLWRSC